MSFVHELRQCWGWEKIIDHVLKLVLSRGTLPSLTHEQSGWRHKHTGVQRNRFCIKCLCRVDMPLYDSCVGYTLTKPWQMLVSFPFKNVVIREQQVWWFFFSFLCLCLFYSVLLQKKKKLCAVLWKIQVRQQHMLLWFSLFNKMFLFPVF